MSAYMLDTNIWLRTVQPTAPQHHLAVEALAVLLARGDDVYVTTQNLIEFWSVASRPPAANGLGWSTVAVRQELERLLAQFPLLDDTATIRTHWLRLVATYGVIGRRVHDARLVAVMLAHGIGYLLTFNDDDFRQFTEVIVVTPSYLISAADTAR